MISYDLNLREENIFMTTEEIIKLAFELGNAIAQSEEIESLKMMQIKISQDQDAYSLIMRYQDTQSKIENKLQEGIAVTSAEENLVDIMEQQINSNPLIQELIQVQEKFDNLMQGVYFAMNQAISGVEGGCSSGCCDSCGGGCN